MKTNGFRVILLLVLFPTFFLSSCVMDSKPLGYSVKNCTKDTLLIDLTDSDSLNSDMYWDLHSKDTIVLMSEDTTSVYIHGKNIEYMKSKGLRTLELPVIYCETNPKRFKTFQFRTKFYKCLVKLGIRNSRWNEKYGV